MSTEQEIIDIIAEQLGIDAADVSAEKSFVEDLNADSLELTALNMTLEEHFDIDIPDSDTEKLKTVGDVFNYVSQRRKENN